jgi:2-dehydropantoate 2-reductase
LEASRRIGVIGLGAIGGPVAVKLARSLRAGEVLGLAAGSEASAAALREGGLRVEEAGRTLELPAAWLQPSAAGPAILLGSSLPALPGGARYELLLLCVRSEATREALAACLPLLAPDGALVCLQNGLPEQAVAREAGEERTLGAVIGWSATVEAKGHYRITGRGGFKLGAFSPAGQGRLLKCQTLLARAFPTSMTPNLAGARWGKLALNCGISSVGAVSGLSFGALARDPLASRLVLRCIGEVVQVARARGVQLEPSSGLRAEWLDGLGAPWTQPLRALLLRLASLQRPRQRSGMLERLLAGRTSGQIDDLNGAVVRAAAELTIDVPVNRALLEAVHRIERGEARPSLETLRQMIV